VCVNTKIVIRHMGLRLHYITLKVTKVETAVQIPLTAGNIDFIFRKCI